jgi:hypothetical protein
LTRFLVITRIEDRNVYITDKPWFFPCTASRMIDDRNDFRI